MVRCEVCKRRRATSHTTLPFHTSSRPPQLRAAAFSLGVSPASVLGFPAARAASARAEAATSRMRRSTATASAATASCGRPPAATPTTALREDVAAPPAPPPLLLLLALLPAAAADGALAASSAARQPGTEAPPSSGRRFTRIAAAPEAPPSSASLSLESTSRPRLPVIISLARCERESEKSPARRCDALSRTSSRALSTTPCTQQLASPRSRCGLSARSC